MYIRRRTECKPIFEVNRDEVGFFEKHILDMKDVGLIACCFNSEKRGKTVKIPKDKCQ